MLSGVAAADKDNGKRVAGVAPDAELVVAHGCCPSRLAARQPQPEERRRQRRLTNPALRARLAEVEGPSAPGSPGPAAGGVKVTAIVQLAPAGSSVGQS